MKKIGIIILLIATISIFNSCCIGMKDGHLCLYQNVKIRERFISPPIDNKVFLFIESTKQLDTLVKNDSITRSRVLYMLWDIDSIVPINDFIVEFPNLKEIEFYKHCSGIFVTKEVNAIKSIILYDSDPKMENLYKLGSIEIIKYHCSYKDSKYFDILKDFKHLNHLVLYLHYKTKSLDKNIVNLEKLEKLDLLQSEMKTIPKAIKNMKSLKELTVDSEQEIEVPKCILEMKSLKVLNIIGNDKYVEMFNKELKDKYPNLQVNSLNRDEYLDKIEYYSVPKKK